MFYNSVLLIKQYLLGKIQNDVIVVNPPINAQICRILKSSAIAHT